MGPLPRIAAALCVAALLLVAGCRQKPSDSSASSLPANLPGCQAAIANTDYGTAFVIPDETKSAVESYRSAWKDFCGTNQQRVKPTMADLVGKAKTLEGLFLKVLDAHDHSHTTEELYATAQTVDDLLRKRYPSFVPGFEGSYLEHEYFQPSTGEFRKNAHLGTVEDQRFFDAGIALESASSWPWMERTWDYGGCLLFGTFEWTETLDTIVQLQKRLQSDIYKQLASDNQDALIDALTSTGQKDVCACGRKDAVMEDLQTALSYLEKEPAVAAYARRVRATIDSIQARTLTVSSEAEKHCSGG